MNFVLIVKHHINIWLTLFSMKTSIQFKTSAILLLFCFTSALTWSQIQLLNDEFGNAASLQANWHNINEVEGWNAEHLEVHDINTSSEGELYMMPYTSSWYQDYRGTLLFKNVAQDFVLTTEVTTTNRAGNGLPSSGFSLAGLMIRSAIDYPNGALMNWMPDQENYIFMATGFANGGSGPHFEVKNTVNGTSNLQITNIPTASQVQIRIARISGAIIVLFRLPGQSWVVHRRFDRSDFPAEIQIGFVTYTDWPKVSYYDEYFHNSHVLNSSLSPDPSAGVPFTPDLIGRFDFARFDDVTVPPQLTGINLVSQASDADLLSFLGYTSDRYCPLTEDVNDTIEMNQIAELSVSQDMTANNLILPAADVRYRAENSIELNLDFEVNLGAMFTAEISDCP